MLSLFLVLTSFCGSLSTYELVVTTRPIEHSIVPNNSTCSSRSSQVFQTKLMRRQLTRESLSFQVHYQGSKSTDMPKL